MKKKIQYINKINDFFINAKNHGNNGNNWWYPKENRIAYNVKMKSFIDKDEIRKNLTERQNDYYTDNVIYQIIDEWMTENCQILITDIDNTFGLESNFAGRSGGWIEVDYKNTLTELEEDTAKEDIDYFHKEAKKLEKLEKQVKEFIQSQHKALNKYIDSKNFYREFTENFTSDEDIAEIYKNKINQLTNKLK